MIIPEDRRECHIILDSSMLRWMSYEANAFRRVMVDLRY